MKKRKDGNYEKTVTIDGKRIHVYGRTQTEIAQQIEALYMDKANGMLGANTIITFEKYAYHWLELHIANKSENTKMVYTRAVNHIVPLIGRIYLVDLKRSEIESALNMFNETVPTRNRILLVTRMILNMAMDDGIIKYNPAMNIKPLKHQYAEKRMLTDKERDAFLNCEVSDTERMFADLLYYTGMRRGEVLGLSRKAIKGDAIRLTEQLQWHKDGSPYITDLKTFASKRDIPVPPELKNRLNDYLKAHNDSIYIFNPLITRHRFQTMWKHILIAMARYMNPNYKPDKSMRDYLISDCPVNITVHQLRHNYASLLYNANVDVRTAQKILGHSNVATTLSIYSHLSEQKEKSEIEKIMDIFAI